MRSVADRWLVGNPSRFLLFLTALAVISVACGGGDEATEVTPATTVAAAPATTAAAPVDESVSIVFIGESSSTDAIWSYAVAEMRDEAESLGAEFVDRFAEGDFQRQAEMIDEEVARGVDAVLAPFFDPQAANEAVRRALAEGIAVYGLLAVPGLEPDEVAQLGSVLASWNQYGRVLAEITLPQIEDGDTILWPAEDPAGTYITEAVVGFEEYAAEQGVNVTVEVLDASSDPSTSASRQLAYLTANPDTGAVVTTGSIAIGAATTAMRQGNLDPGSPPLAGFVTNAQAFQGVVDGYIQQGIWPALDEVARQAIRDVVATVRDGAPPANRTQPWVIVDQSNVAEVVPEGLHPATTATTAAAPVDESVSIVFIGESSSTDAIWSYAVAEMRDEAESLGAEFVDRFAEGDFQRQAEMIDEEVARGVDAVLAPFFDPQAANEAVRRALAEGIAVYGLLAVPGLDPDEVAQLGSVLASWNQYGRVLAEITLPQIEDGDTILWPAEDPAGTYITEAVVGFEEYAAEQGVNVTVEVLDASSDPSTSASRQLAYLTANPDTGAVVTTGSIAIGAATTAMRQGNLDPGSPPLAGFVTNAQAFQGVVDGYIQQGIWPALDEVARQAIRDVVATVRDGAPPANRTQPWVIVDQSNVAEVVPEGLHP